MSRWYLLSAKIQCFLFKGTLVTGGNAAFNVPLCCDGRGRVVLGDCVTIGYAKAPKISGGKVFLQARMKNAVISIGDRTATSNNVVIVANQAIAIGADCLIGDNVGIADSDFHNVEPELRHQPSKTSKPVTIGNNVWIGSRALIMKGVEIGDNSVVAAGAVVVKSVPSNAMAAGVPAKVVKRI